MNPTNPYTGNPIGQCIRAQDFIKKYFISESQLATMCKRRLIAAFFMKGDFWVLDAPPDQHCDIMNASIYGNNT